MQCLGSQSIDQTIQIQKIRDNIFQNTEEATRLIKDGITENKKNDNLIKLLDFQLLKIELHAYEKDYAKMKIDLIKILRNQPHHLLDRQKLLIKYYQIFNDILNLDTIAIQPKIDRLLIQAQQKKNILIQAKCLYLKGFQLDNTTNYQEAIAFHHKAISKYQAINDSNNIVKNLFSIASCYYSLKKHKEAIVILNEYLSYCDRHHLDKMCGYGNTFLGQIYFDLFDYDAAKKYFHKSMQVNSNKKMGNVLTSLKYLGHIFNDLHQYDSSSYYFRRYIDIVDTIDLKMSLKEAEEIERAYLKELQQSNIKRKDLKIKSIIKTRNLTILFSIIALTLLAIIFFIVLKAYRIKSKLNKHLEIQKQSILNKNEQIDIALKEKVILLKEIHHRVKNNLQIISSLLNLQSRNITDPVALTLLDEGKDRIQAISLIHKKLYLSDSFATIDINEYIQELLQQIEITYAKQGKKIEFNIEVQNIHISLDTAVPIGLIICELITNAFKHAFSGRNEGLIQISIQRTNTSNLFILKFSDNGIGFDVVTTQPGLGSEIIEALTEQLDGKMLVESSESGSNFTIEFYQINSL